jgi:hypothetical protein
MGNARVVGRAGNAAPGAGSAGFAARWGGLDGRGGLLGLLAGEALVQFGLERGGTE